MTMGSLVVYSLQSSVILLAGYLVYKWLLASEKQLTFNRLIILVIYTFSLLAPLLIAFLSSLRPFPLHVSVNVEEVNLVSVTTQNIRQSWWAAAIIAIYCLGIFTITIHSIVVIFRLMSLIRSGKHIRQDGYILVLLSGNIAAPFSWGHYIVMSHADYKSAGDVITSHELAHIRYHHCIDLLIAQLACALQWFNPATWLLREELKNVHEFQADDSVICKGMDMRQYQLLLIKKAVGIRFHSIANSLNHSNLKKRITMMYNQIPPRRRCLRGFALFPAVAAALALSNVPAVASALSAIGSASFAMPFPATGTSHTAIVSKVTENDAATQHRKLTTGQTDTPDSPEIKVDKTAQFPGGEVQMFKFMCENMKFPLELLASHISGKVVIKFVVKTDGSLSDFTVVKSLTPEADAEAIRVAKKMPKWKPAMLNGKAVESTYELPVAFKCQ